jgi:hypothetical protein
VFLNFFLILGLSLIYCMGPQLVDHYTTIVLHSRPRRLVPFPMCPMCFHFAPRLCDDGFSNGKCNNIPSLASNTYLRCRKWLDNCVIRNDATVCLLSEFEPMLSLTGLICSANLSSTSLIALRIWITSRRLKLQSSRMPVSREAYSTLLYDSCSIFP